MLLEKLCNAFGVCGCETEVREIIKEEIAPYVDEISVDNMGNLLAKKLGKSHDKTVMLAAHTDEVGFIISGITKEGYLEFKTVGGIDTRVIISKRVSIGKDRIKGIIGIKAVHLTTKSERESVPKVSDLYIDIGAKDEEDAKKHIKLGDYVEFDTKYEELMGDTIKAKAIDDRAGCYIMCKLIKEAIPAYDTVFCFSTQEEAHFRGSTVAAYKIRPDISLVIEATTSAHAIGIREHEQVAVMNEGAAVTFMDNPTIVDEDFSKWLYNSAKENNIPVQYKTVVAGGNDAGIIHKTAEGIKTASISVPCRYLHSPVSIASKKDINSVYDLSKLFLENADKL